MNLNEKTCPKPKTSPGWKETLLKVQNGPELIPSTLGSFLSYEKVTNVMNVYVFIQTL